LGTETKDIALDMHCGYRTPNYLLLSLCGALGLNSEQAELNLANCKGWSAWILTGAMRTAPTPAVEILLRLSQLHLQLEAEARAGIYRLYYSYQLKPRSEGFGHAYMTQGRNPCYRWGLTD
jgi:hypothetical protein